MEFDFDVHKIFLDPITKLDRSLIPVRRPLISSSEALKQTMAVIDEIGKASAKAQQLPAPITSASRMQINQHQLYILKDCTPQTAGRGLVIGFLKVGYKKLFVLDHKGSHIEAEPLCILDFYIHESLQRHGFGKEVFNFMLRSEQMEPQHLAIDRPSEKFLSFLRKHYNLRSTIPQVNNFVIFEGFFRDRKAPVRKLPPKRLEGEIKPYSLSDREFLKHEEGLPWPLNQAQSALNRAGSLGSSPTRARPPPREDDFVKSLRVCRPHSLHRAANGEQEDSSQRRRTSVMNFSRGLMAQQNCYSRYTSASPPLLRRAPPAEDIKEKHNVTDKSMSKDETSDVASPDQNGRLTSNHYPLHTQKPHQQTTGHSKQEPPEAIKSLEKPEDKAGVHVSRTQWSEQPSWTVLGTVMNAQFVRRKQELRGTRPW
ncbi:PREDICTED: alpha-tubulin N-acetyltransferase 1 [Nanorana parkeri]|uniref:alpha-tubulin N-acetyltransferase 1 n=1 Tax=Nanorana parkeri TaxID=125878 RepID=UPI000854C87F|nr:PREDICTED: alpha-tubulin N-acetyltransferase 1 [Nanorana parkeri]